MEMRQARLIGQQHRIEAEIGADVEKILEPMFVDELAATRKLPDFVGPPDDELLIDPVAIVQHPFPVQAGIDAKATAQPIKPFQQTPVQFFHVFLVIRRSTRRHDNAMYYTQGTFSLDPTPHDNPVSAQR
jgi:hypothetical protein